MPSKHKKHSKKHHHKKRKVSSDSSSSSSFYSKSFSSYHSDDDESSSSETFISRKKERPTTSTTTDAQPKPETQQLTKKRETSEEIRRREKRRQDLLENRPVEPEEPTQLEVQRDFYPLNLTDLPNINRKLVIFNLPPNVNDDEIRDYIFTLLTTLNPNNITGNPILNIEKKENGLYYIVELLTKDDIEILINMDHTQWRGYRIRIQKPRRFFDDYNDTYGQTVNRRPINKQQSSVMDADNKLFLGGIPTTATENEVRKIVEAFGQLKTFNLVRDPEDDKLNRGFAFLEYEDPKVTERAINGLDGREIGEKKLRVQKASLNMKSGILAQQQKTQAKYARFGEGGGTSHFTEKTIQDFYEKEQMEVPVFAMMPSRVVQFINMIEPEDVMDDLEYREIVDDIKGECLQFGTILNVEIPRPDKINHLAGPAVGKVFVKFSTLSAAKKARFRLSGRLYNRRTVVASFYPENYFDVREFNFSGFNN